MLDLGNPPHSLGLASCPFEITEDLQNFSFVTLKSCSLVPIIGPCLFEEIEADTFINRWGLDNSGVGVVATQTLDRVLLYQPNVILSAFIATVEEVQPFLSQVPLTKLRGIELNLSCPNKNSITQFSDITREVRERVADSLPVGLKIGLDFPIERLKDLSPDFVTFSNTISSYKKGFGAGGVSGDPLRDAVRRQLDKVRSLVQGTLLACGGVKDATTYQSYLALGADYVALASHYLKNKEVLFQILSEI